MEHKTEIKNAKYQKDSGSSENNCVVAEIDGQVWTVPMDENNSHYAEILKQVEDKTLTIADAD